MKTYNIGIWEEQGGYIYIKAENKKEAKKIALKMVEKNGIDILKEDKNFNIDITHRNVEIIN